MAGLVPAIHGLLSHATNKDMNTTLEAAVMEMMVISKIEQLVRRFVSGADTSIKAANEIELAFDDSFPDDDYVQRTVEMLAMYRPEGGELLFDTAAITQRLIETMKHLRKTT